MAGGQALVDEEIAEFLRGPVAIFLGTTDEHGTPDATRGHGVEVINDHRLRVVVSSEARHAIANAAAGRPAAVLVTDITTYRSLQWKGTLVGPAKPRTPRDLAVADGNADAFARGSVVVGLEPGDCWRFVAHDFVAVELDVAELFDQTPGPGAGRRVGA
jgi:hypothetical protein